MEELNVPMLILGLMSPILVIVCSMCWYTGKVWAMRVLFGDYDKGGRV